MFYEENQEDTFSDMDYSGDFAPSIYVYYYKN